MNPLHWQDPEVFNPDRFIENQQSSPIHKNSLLYFGGGCKICPGERVATLQLKCLLVLFYRKYDIKLKDPNQPIKYFSTVVNHCLELPIKVTKKSICIQNKGKFDAFVFLQNKCAKFFI